MAALSFTYWAKGSPNRLAVFINTETITTVRNSWHLVCLNIFQPFDFSLSLACLFLGVSENNFRIGECRMKFCNLQFECSVVGLHFDFAKGLNNLETFPNCG